MLTALWVTAAAAQCHGASRTRDHGEDRQDAIDAVIDKIPAGRVGRPDDVAATIAFLASAGADYISGQVIHVNGGWLFGG